MSDKGIKEYTKIKQRLIDEFKVNFPIVLNRRKGLENGIERYEKLSQKNKKTLGKIGLDIFESDKENQSKGVNGMGDSLDD